MGIYKIIILKRYGERAVADIGKSLKNIIRASRVEGWTRLYSCCLSGFERGKGRGGVGWFGLGLGLGWVGSVSVRFCLFQFPFDLRMFCLYTHTYTHIYTYTYVYLISEARIKRGLGAVRRGKVRRHRIG